MKWLNECNQEKGLRVYGQAITTMNLKSPQCFSLNIFNLFDASPPWRRILMGTPEERIAKMRDPEMRRNCKDQWEQDPIDNPEKFASIDRSDLVLPIEAVAPRSVWREKTSRAPTSRELFRPKPAGTPAELPTAPSRACLLFVSGRSLVGALVGGQLLLNYYRFCTSSIVFSKVQNASYSSNA